MHPKGSSNLTGKGIGTEPIPRVALTLKITKPDYVRLSKLRLKELEAGHDLTHQQILYDALRSHLKKRGV